MDLTEHIEVSDYESRRDLVPDEDFSCIKPYWYATLLAIGNLNPCFELCVPAPWYERRQAGKSFSLRLLFDASFLDEPEEELQP